MKLYFSFAAFFAALVITLSCNKVIESPALVAEDVLLTLSVDLAGNLSKASSTVSEPVETAITDVQILIFDSSNRIAAYLSNGVSVNASVTLKEGTYLAAAVLNGPNLSSVASLSELRSTTAPLSQYNSTSSSFVMYGEKSSINLVKNGNNSSVIQASRLVSRVRLVSVRNECPAALGSLLLKDVFLSNVVGNQNLYGNESPSLYYNMYGRSDIANTSSIINGLSFKATPENLTYTSLSSQSVAHSSTLTCGQNFYSYPNPAQDVVTSYSSSWTPTALRLVLKASLDGRDYYYPVALPSASANTSYDVRITVRGTGLDDPQGDIKDLTDKGTVNVSVNIADWNSGNEFSVVY